LDTREDQHGEESQGKAQEDRGQAAGDAQEDFEGCEEAGTESADPPHRGQGCAAPPQPPAPGERIGVVTHYYGNVSVAIIKLEPGTALRVGDNIHIRGHTSDFGQRVESLQVGHAPVSEVGPHDDFGLKVTAHAREHDVVYKVK
jgi:putative protease